MKIYAPNGIHVGVFQSLTKDIFNYEIDIPQWSIDIAPVLDCVNIVGKKRMQDYFKEYDVLILHDSPLYTEIRNLYNGIIIYYDVMNGRGKITNDRNDSDNQLFFHPKTALVFVSNGARMSHGVFRGRHKTIYPGINENFWKGYNGEEKRIVHVRNQFEMREKERYGEFKKICGDNPCLLIGHGNPGSVKNFEQLRKIFQESRVYVNIELTYSTFNISCMQAMMTGMPIVSNDVECNGEHIRNGVEGFISNDIEYLKDRTQVLLDCPKVAKQLGDNARKMARIKYSAEVFNLQWNDLLDNLEDYLWQSD